MGLDRIIHLNGGTGDRHVTVLCGVGGPVQSSVPLGVELITPGTYHYITGEEGSDKWMFVNNA